MNNKNYIFTMIAGLFFLACEKDATLYDVTVFASADRPEGEVLIRGGASKINPNPRIYQASCYKAFHGENMASCLLSCDGKERALLTPKPHLPTLRLELEQPENVFVFGEELKVEYRLWGSKWRPALKEQDQDISACRKDFNGDVCLRVEALDLSDVPGVQGLNEKLAAAVAFTENNPELRELFIEMKREFGQLMDLFTPEFYRLLRVVLEQTFKDAPIWSCHLQSIDSIEKLKGDFELKQVLKQTLAEMQFILGSFYPEVLTLKQTGLKQNGESLQIVGQMKNGKIFSAPPSGDCYQLGLTESLESCVVPCDQKIGVKVSQGIDFDRLYKDLSEQEFRGVRIRTATLDLNRAEVQGIFLDELKNLHVKSVRLDPNGSPSDEGMCEVSSETERCLDDTAKLLLMENPIASYSALLERQEGGVFQELAGKLRELNALFESQGVQGFERQGFFVSKNLKAAVGLFCLKDLSRPERAPLLESLRNELNAAIDFMKKAPKSTSDVGAY